MTDFNTESNTGTETLDTSEAQGLDSILGEATSDSDSNEQASSKSEGEASQSSDDEGTVRSIAELNEIAADKGAKLTPAERKKVLMAARNGKLSDEELDEQLQQQLNQDSDRDTQSESEKDKGKPDESGEEKEKTDESEEDVDTDEEDGDDEEKTEVDTNEAEDALESLLKVVAPHAKTPEDGIKAIKNLQYTLQRQGEFINAVKKSGFNSPEQLTEAAKTLSTIDKNVEEHLKTQEGLAKLYKAYNIDMPGFAKAEKAAEDGKTSDNADVNDIIKKVEDEGFIEAKDFKNFLPALIKSVKESVSKDMTEMQNQMKNVGSFLQKQTATLQNNEEMRQIFEDAHQVADTFGAHDGRLSLKDSPAAIYKASFDDFHKPLAKQHPELKNLQNIVKVRQMAILHAQDLSKKIGKEVMPDVMGYLSKMFMTTGGFKKVVNGTKRTQSNKLISNLAKKLQPGLGKGNKSSGPDTFKVPKTEQDVAKMSKKDKAKFLQKVRKGQIVINV